MGLAAGRGGPRAPRPPRAGRAPRVAGAALVATALLLAGCATADAPAASTVVEVDVYSGRANPSWVMTDDEVADLRRAVDRLAEPSGHATPLGAGLGFRGFLVHDVVLTDAAGPTDLTVVDGAVVRRSGSPATWPDPDSTVLALLLDHAGDHLDPADLRALEESVAR